MTGFYFVQAYLPYTHYSDIIALLIIYKKARPLNLMPTNKERVVIYLDHQDKEALQKLAQSQYRSMSAQALIAVKHEIQRAKEGEI